MDAFRVDFAIHFLPGLALALYCFSWGMSMRGLVRQTSGGGKSWVFPPLGAAFVLHGIFLLFMLGWYGSKESSVSHMFHLNVAEALLFIAWAVVAVVFVLHTATLNKLVSFILPVALTLMVASSLLFHFDHSEGNISSSSSALLWAHIFGAVLGHVSFALSFSVSLAIIFSDALLRRKKWLPVLRRLPALAVLDRLNALLLTLGFWFVFVSIALGFVVRSARADDQRFFLYDPQVVISLGIILFYGFFLSCRQFFGWRGRRLSLASVFGFVAICLVYLYSAFREGGFHVS